MKRILFFVLILISSGTAFAQKDTTGLNIPVKDGNVVYERVVEIPGKSKADLYKNAKQWFVDYFKSSRDVIQSEDKGDGKIVGKGILPVLFNGAMGTQVIYDDNLSIQVDCKDGKYRVRIYEQLLSSPVGGQVTTTPEELIAKLLGTGSSPFNAKQARRMLESMNSEMLSTLASVNRAMSARTDDF
ncbi:protein of unknown function [Mucilaginibacter mallensis]|uniref:DUF4468 domain-containing protein n=1 Tax=Mucilaginibacter mallensis TaxID=652787 RepID=A0A1H1MK67_MUCMA|nr:DUF4468 domain-containing protein [Mucilaginibacter mallensis]SDR87241.1 protein of unknown function [Mucilaginibacter mallensis]